MRYVVAPNGVFSHTVSALGNQIWDDTHFCPASALTVEEATMFGVFELVNVSEPIYDPYTQSLEETDPIQIEGVWTQNWSIIELSLDQAQSALRKKVDTVCVQIDKDTDSIYAAVIGNRQSEYMQAEIEASAYKSANYTGVVPSMVSSWSQVKGWTGQQAADDILTVAAQWRYAQSVIRATRLQMKEEARNSSTVSEFEAVLNSWFGFTVAIKAQLGL